MRSSARGASVTTLRPGIVAIQLPVPAFWGAPDEGLGSCTIYVEVTLPGAPSSATVDRTERPWRYIGSVSIDSIPLALLQDHSNGDAGYYGVGEILDGVRIRSIGMESMLLADARGRTIRLEKTHGIPDPAETPPAYRRGWNSDGPAHPGWSYGAIPSAIPAAGAARRN